MLVTFPFTNDFLNTLHAILPIGVSVTMLMVVPCKMQ